VIGNQKSEKKGSKEKYYINLYLKDGLGMEFKAC